MGFYSHTILSVTIDLFDEDNKVELEYIHREIKRLMGEYSCLVTPITGYMKGTYSFAILPDGQKEFRLVSDEVDACRKKVGYFLETVYENKPSPLSSDKTNLLSIDWVEVTYSSDRGEAEILDQSWR